MPESDQRSFLDRPAARELALIIILLCGVCVIYLHRDDFWPHPENAADIAKGGPAAPCIEKRFTDIDNMMADGTIEMAQVQLFKQRAEAMCRETQGGNNPSTPALPGPLPE